METRQINEYIDSWRKFEIMALIFIQQCKDEISLSDLARKIGISPTHRYFHYVIGVLIDFGGVKSIREIAGTKLIKLDLNRIGELLYECDPYFKISEKIIAERRLLYKI